MDGSSWLFSYLIRFSPPPQKFNLQIIKFLWPQRSLSSPWLPWRKVWLSPRRTQWDHRRTLGAWFQHIDGCEFRSKSFIPWELDLDKDLWDCQFPHLKWWQSCPLRFVRKRKRQTHRERYHYILFYLLTFSKFKSYFGSGFLRFQSVIHCPVVLGPVVRRMVTSGSTKHRAEQRYIIHAWKRDSMVETRVS